MGKKVQDEGDKKFELRKMQKNTYDKEYVEEKDEGMYRNNIFNKK